MSKLDQIKALRVARAMRFENAKALRRPPVTESLRAVTKTIGRPRKADKLSPAEKQRAYRQRHKGSKGLSAVNG